MTNERSLESGNPIKLAEHRIFSESFKSLYDEGMTLVEHTAEYLDGAGRAEAKKLSRLAATLYAAESMRLTTRLMQVASWLLLQRAANSGEMTRDQVACEKVQGAAGYGLRTGKRHRLGRTAGRASCNLSAIRCACKILSGVWTRRFMHRPRRPRLLLPRRSNPVSDQINLLATAFAR